MDHHRRVHVAPRVLVATSIINVLLSIALIAVGFWLALRHHINCIKFLEIPILFIGFALFVMSMVGILGVKKHRASLVGLYLVVVFFLLLLLLIFTLFAFLVTNGGDGHNVAAANFQEYSLGDYSQWLLDQVQNSYKWLFLEACIKDGFICNSLNRDYTTLSDFMGAPLSPIQSGCCKPPIGCGFGFVKPTQWVNPATPGTSSDCGRWNNSDLCYECDACKAGLLEHVRSDWRKVAKVCVVVLILLILAYLVLWCAFVAAIWDRFFKHNRLQPGTFSTPQ